MLISMPTDTSTIFGVFQLISVLPEIRRERHAAVDPRSRSNIVQGPAIEHSSAGSPSRAPRTSLQDKPISLQDKAEPHRRLPTDDGRTTSTLVRAAMENLKEINTGSGPC